MAEITVRKHVAAPVEKVFALATDFRNVPRFVKGITKLEVITDGPVGKGTRFRETRKVFNREATEEMEVTDFHPPRGYSVGCESHGCRFDTDFTFSPDGEGTALEMTFRAKPVTFGAKVMSVLMRPMMKSVMKECAKDLDDLKAAAESRDPARDS